MSLEKQPKRQPVNYRYEALNHDFIKLMAEIAHYAAGKYGSAEQYVEARLEGEKSPINHIYEHLRSYQDGESHDHFQDPIYHLAAIAYNASMEALYLRKFGKSNTVVNLTPKPTETQGNDAKQSNLTFKPLQEAIDAARADYWYYSSPFYLWPYKFDNPVWYNGTTAKPNTFNTEGQPATSYSKENGLKFKEEPAPKSTNFEVNSNGKVLKFEGGILHSVEEEKQEKYMDNVFPFPDK